MDHAGDDILFRTGASPAVRVVFGLIGVAVAVWPAHDLHPWSVPLPLGLFMWVIVLGAWVIAGALLVGAVLGRPGEVRAVPGGLELTEIGWPGNRRRVFPAAALGDPEVRVSVNDNGPDTFHVTLPRGRRPALSTPSFATRAEAEALAARLRAALGR